MKIEYRVNTPVSAKEIAALRESVCWNRMEDCYNNLSFISRCHIACYAENGLLIGHVDTVSNGVTDAYIQDLIVHSEHQNQGIGTELMNRIIAQLKEDKIYMISIVFEEKLLSFHSKFDFFKMMCGQMQTYECD